MLLTSSSKLPDDDHHWAFEVKYDGWRVLLYLDRGELRLISRNGHDLTERAPELDGLGAALRRRRLILDGELVVADEHGRPDFDRLQGRMHGADDAALTPSSSTRSTSTARTSPGSRMRSAAAGSSS